MCQDECYTVHEWARAAHAPASLKKLGAAPTADGGAVSSGDGLKS